MERRRRTTASCAWWSTRPAATTRPTRSSGARSQAAGPQLHVILVGDEPRVARAAAGRTRSTSSVVHAARRDRLRRGAGDGGARQDRLEHRRRPQAGARRRGRRLRVAPATPAPWWPASVLYVRRITGVQRPAICTIMPCHARARRLPRRRRQRRGTAPSTCASSRSWARRSPARSWASPSPTVGLLSHRRGADQGHAATSSRPTSLIAADPHIRLLRQRRGPRHHEPRWST